MPEVEPKETPTDNFDAKADKFLAENGEETAEDSSGLEDTTEESKENKDAGVDQSKKASPEKSEEETEKEEDIPENLKKDMMFRKGYNTMKAKHDKTLKEMEGKTLSEDERQLLDNFKQVKDAPWFIRDSMKAQGYTDEAIDKKLQEMGHQVQPKAGDDVDLVIRELKLDPKGVDENQRLYITDLANIARVIVKDAMGKTLPNEMNPLKETLGKITSRESAKELMTNMREIVEDEKILNFEEDIDPELSKFMDTLEGKKLSTDEMQRMVFEHFKDVYHRLSVDRLKNGKRKADRDETKKSLRGITRTVPMGQLPKRTGDYDTDADNFLDAAGAD